MKTHQDAYHPGTHLIILRMSVCNIHAVNDDCIQENQGWGTWMEYPSRMTFPKENGLVIRIIHSCE